MNNDYLNYIGNNLNLDRINNLIQQQKGKITSEDMSEMRELFEAAGTSEEKQKVFKAFLDKTGIDINALQNGVSSSNQDNFNSDMKELFKEISNGTSEERQKALETFQEKYGIDVNSIKNGALSGESQKALEEFKNRTGIDIKELLPEEARKQIDALQTKSNTEVDINAIKNMASSGNQSNATGNSNSSILMNYNAISSNANSFRSVKQELKQAWQSVTKTEIPKIQNSWAGQGSKTYVDSVLNFDSKINAAIDTLDLLSSTFEKASNEMQQTEINVQRYVGNL